MTGTGDARHDRLQGDGVLVARYGDAHELTAGLDHPADLLERRLDVARVRLGHRLDDDRRPAADRTPSPISGAWRPQGDGIERLWAYGRMRMRLASRVLLPARSLPITTTLAFTSRRCASVRASFRFVFFESRRASVYLLFAPSERRTRRNGGFVYMAGQELSPSSTRQRSLQLIEIRTAPRRSTRCWRRADEARRSRSARAACDDPVEDVRCAGPVGAPGGTAGCGCCAGPSRKRRPSCVVVESSEGATKEPDPRSFPA